ncbi:MAG TPA: hypothetical protein PK926_11060 [Spirochaetota bacterium]|nr:hypothetical protein [Spirochaetota bacterium]HPI88411.1 hypothetical protein [Spirochaetota bacterium]HPR49880.1 hypothetical protein [Spirochaetota bacterium]
MTKKGKSNLFKSLQPVNMSDVLNRGFNGLDIGQDLGTLQSSSREKRFLRTFTADGLFSIMKKVGLVEHLSKLGMDDVFTTIDVDDTGINYMKIYWKEEKPEMMLFDLRLSESRFLPDKRFFEDEDSIIPYDMVVIEWLSAQNPMVTFSNDKPQLPGQSRPGLGILRYCFDMMYIVAKEIIKDGFLDIPDHFHGAVMYSKKFKFFDPAHEGVLRALMRDLKQYSLYDITWGILTGTIIEQYTNAPQPYDPSEQIFYVSERMRHYFRSSKYRNVYNKYYKRKKFKFNYDEMVARRKEVLKSRAADDL